MEKFARANNRRGISSWISTVYGLDRYLYVLQRVTGVGLFLFLLLHLCVTGIRLRGLEAWETTMAVMEHPTFLALEYVVFVASIFHGLNGIRLFLGQMGWTLGRPGQPVYPYRPSLRRQRKLVLALGIIFLALAVAGIMNLVRG